MYLIFVFHCRRNMKACQLLISLTILATWIVYWEAYTDTNNAMHYPYTKFLAQWSYYSQLPTIKSDFHKNVWFSFYPWCVQSKLSLVKHGQKSKIGMVLKIRDPEDLETVLREAFKKKNDETYGKFHILGGGVSKGSFSICYNDIFKMHKKPF